MFYVVGEYRIVVESEAPVNMKDYPKCELIEGAPGVDMINFEVYEEGGVKKVKSKEIEKLELIVSCDLEQETEGIYKMKLPSEPIEIKMKMEGQQHIPKVMTLPEGYEKKQIDVRCTRGKLSSNKIIGSGSVWWTPVEETVDVAILFSVLNFPPVQTALNIRLYTEEMNNDRP